MGNNFHQFQPTDSYLAVLIHHPYFAIWQWNECIFERDWKILRSLDSK
jgi:hypothetical protein